MKTEQIKQKLIELSNSNTSTEADEIFMTALIEVMGLQGRVTCGIVYLMPYGKNPPTDIHQFAKYVLMAMEKEAV